MSLASRFCTTAILTLRWGFGVSSPKGIVRAATEFSDKYVEKNGLFGDLSLKMFDIKEFFPNVDVKLLEQAVYAAIEELRDMKNGWEYF
jgi:hypothetical protein